MRYVPSREASRILGVHPQTLKTWAREGRIDYIRTEGNQRRYDVDSYLGNPDQHRPSATAASPRSSRQTSTGRSPSCENDILTPRSSETSAPDSTSGAKGYLPYWSDYSSVLWSPTETVLRGLERNSSDALERNGGELVVSISGPQPRAKSSRLTFSPSSTVFGARVRTAAIPDA